MYPLTPVRVYAHERIRKDDACMTRMQRMLAAIGNSADDVVWITKENLPDVALELERLWPPAMVSPGQTLAYTRPLVFTTMDLSYKRPDLKPLLARCPEGVSLNTLQAIEGHMTTAIDQHLISGTRLRTASAGRPTTSGRSLAALTGASTAAPAGPGSTSPSP